MEHQISLDESALAPDLSDEPSAHEVVPEMPTCAVLLLTSLSLEYEGKQVGYL